MPLLILLCAAQFMVILDITVVNLALPSIQAELGIAVADLQWVITAYTVTFGGLLLLGGRAADLFGQRRMFLAGLSVFTVASLGAAMSDSTTALVAARISQGIGAAMLSPAALSLVTTSFPEGPERQRALAAWAAVAASGGAFGVLIGGFLTETFSWTAIFLINVPVGVAVALGLLRLLPASARTAHGSLDYRGAVLATASLAAMIYGLVEAPSAGWASIQTLGFLGAAAIGLVAFVAVESRVREPLVDFGVLRRRPTVVALVLMIIGMGTVLSAFFFLTLYLQNVLGHSALQTGFEFLPGAILLVVAAHLGGHIVSRHGAKLVLVAGLGLAALGTFLLSGVSPDGSYLRDVLPGLLVLDAGIGIAAPAIFITALSGVRDNEAGLVSGLTSTAHELGAALILPILSTVAVSSLGTATLESALGLDPGLITGAFGDAFLVSAAIALAASVLAAVALRGTDVAPGAAPTFAH